MRRIQNKKNKKVCFSLNNAVHWAAARKYTLGLFKLKFGPLKREKWHILACLQQNKSTLACMCIKYARYLPYKHCYYMKISELRLNSRLDRSIFTIETKKKTNNTVFALSNRQLIYEWIKEQPGTAYINRIEGAQLLTNYSQIAKALIKDPVLNIFFVTIQPFSQDNYTITKLPLLRKL